MNSRPSRSFFALFIGALLAVGCAGDQTSASSSVDRLEASKVPEQLRPLIPLAERWGIGDDIERGEKVDGSSPEERAELREAVNANRAEIDAWLDSFGRGDAMSDEAAAFMYMSLAVEEFPE